MFHTFLCVLLLFSCFSHNPVYGALSSSESVIVRGADDFFASAIGTLVAAVDALPLAEQLDVDRADLGAMQKALRTSQSLRKDKQTLSAVREALASSSRGFPPQAIACEPTGGEREPTQPINWLGVSVELEWIAQLDQNCDGTPEPASDLIVELLIEQSVVPFVVTQTTSDSRFMSSVEVLFTTNGETLITKNALLMRGLFFPALIDPLVNPILLRDGNAMPAIYDNLQFTDAPITFVAPRTCNNPDTNRFSQVQLGLVFGISVSQDTALESSGFCSAGPPSSVNELNNANTGVSFGKIYVDQNRDNIRSPYEQIVPVENTQLVIDTFSLTSDEEVASSDTTPLGDGYVVLFNSAGATDFAMSVESANGLVTEDGTTNDVAVCGSADPRLSVVNSVVPPDVNAGRSNLVSHASEPPASNDPRTMLSVVALPSDVNRMTAGSIGVSCEAERAVPDVDDIRVEVQCSAEVLELAEGSVIVDRFKIVTTNRLAHATFQSWFAASSVGDLPIAEESLFGALDNTITTSYASADILPAQGVASTRRDSRVSVLELTTPRLSGADLPQDAETSFEIDVQTTYASANSPCPGLPGENVVVELLLNAHSFVGVNDEFRLGIIGERCVHVQPEICQDGSLPPFNPLPPIGDLESGDGPFIAVMTVVVIVIACFLCMCTSRNSYRDNRDFKQV